MRATIKDIIPGRVLYSVFCVGANSVECAYLECKVIITSNVYQNKTIDKPCFNCIDDYRPYGSDLQSLKSRHFLGDRGLDPDCVYNLHRLFTTEESALAYVEECHKGQFSNPIDRAFFLEDLYNPEDDFAGWEW